MSNGNRPADITVLSFLFLLGALVCAICGLGVLLPATEPHPFLRMIPALAVLGSEALSWLVFVCLACVVAALGLWRCSYWGFLAAILVLFSLFASHILRALLSSQWWEILLILAIGAPVIWYLHRRSHLFLHHAVSP